jgi:hypothetical protein
MPPVTTVGALLFGPATDELRSPPLVIEKTK